MPVTEFVGVTKDKERGVTSGRGLYEFWTEDLAHIYLHDIDFKGLTYQPGRPPVLELVFDHGTEWAPPELSKTPVVVFRFEDVRLIEWHEDQEGHDCVAAAPEAPPGQVDLFDWDGGDSFSLHTFTLRLDFRASRAEVTVRAE